MYKLICFVILVFAISACMSEIENNSPKSSVQDKIEHESPQSTSAPKVSNTKPNRQKESEITNKETANTWLEGKVVFNKFEGGFYGIELTTGEKLLPLNLAEPYLIAGTVVRVKVEKQKLMTIQQWGTPVNILDIKLVTKSTTKQVNNLL